MQNNDIAEKNAKLMLDVITYAHDNHLDLNNKKDVKTILNVLNPEHADDASVDAFMPMIDIATRMIESEVNELKQKRSQVTE